MSSRMLRNMTSTRFTSRIEPRVEPDGPRMRFNKMWYGMSGTRFTCGIEPLFGPDGQRRAAARNPNKVPTERLAP